MAASKITILVVVLVVIVTGPSRGAKPRAEYTLQVLNPFQVEHAESFRRNTRAESHDGDNEHLYVEGGLFG
jgi:hypothetical protein